MEDICRRRRRRRGRSLNLRNRKRKEEEMSWGRRDNRLRLAVGIEGGLPSGH